jgi:hypothetical protein
VKAAYEELKGDSMIKKWGIATDDRFSRRPVAIPELKMVGIKDPGAIAIASVRNDLAFLVTVVGVSSVLAVLAGAFLPGDAPPPTCQNFTASYTCMAT